MPDEHVPVLIIGAGTVGLSCAVALQRHGVRAMAIERRSGLSIHPRATGVQPPAREFFRAMGLDEEVRQASAALRPSLSKINVHALTDSLSEVPRFPTPPPNVIEVTRRISPTDIGPCAQDQLDQVLLDACRADDVPVRFNTEMVGLEQDSRGVTVRVADRDTGQQRAIRADYVIAADGGRSPTRELLGIAVDGMEKLTNPMVNMLFQADLSELVRGHEFAFCEVRNDDLEGILVAVNNTDRWVFHVTYDEEKETPEDYPNERCKALVRGAVGIPDLKVDILAKLSWQMSSRVADRMRVGRVFLAGDAAHTIPPIGAFGLSTGIADGYNLAWKLALVLAGQAGPRLLDSYQDERLPIVRFAQEQTLLRFRNLHLQWTTGPEADAERKRLNIADPLVLGFGYQYSHGAILNPRTTLPSHTNVEHNLDGHPGTRLPHTWLTPTHSTLDLAGPHHALLTGPDNHHWTHATTHTPIPLTTHTITNPTWLATTGLTTTGALLVRPDNIIAWRTPTAPPNPTTTLHHTLTQLLDLPA